MGDLIKKQFDALDLPGTKYLEWKVDAEMNLKAQGLEHTIHDSNNLGDYPPSDQEKAKALVFLRHHLHESLKFEYLFVDDPKQLWDSLNDRYGHQQMVLLPKAKFEWSNLRFQDFKSVSDYTSAMHRLVSMLRNCNETVTEAEMIDKTLNTFHASNVILQTQYRERRFTKFSDLLSVLLVAEQNNDILLMNHNKRPTGSQAIHESNATEDSNIPPEANAIHRHGRGGYNGRGGYHGHGGFNGRGGRNGRGRGRGNYHGRGRGRGRNNFAPRNNNFKNNDNKQKGHHNGSNYHGPSKGKDGCYRCGMTGHWGRTCRTAKHLVDLYQSSLKAKNAEANFNETNKFVPSLDVSDFFDDETGNELVIGECSNL